MKIEFVNHSSFIIDHEGVRVICDPWLEGSVFNNGWSLISPTKFSYNDFSSIQYIWFSHEHPDHFFPPNIKKIPAEYRAQITVLFQFTLDKRVVDWCKKQGFKNVVEMHPDKWVDLGQGLKALCEHFDEGDSWVCFKTEKQTYLNTNDCGIRNKNQVQYIKNKTGQPDVLLTQFSYAYWAGNPDQGEYRKKIADEKLEWMKFQCDLFNPTYVIPIASYIYFSHAENNYLNDEVNTAGKTFDFLKNRTSAVPVVLYNGDSWQPGEEHDSLLSVSKYMADFESAKSNISTFVNSVEETRLKEIAEAFGSELKRSNNFYLKLSLKPAFIYVPDYKKSFFLTLEGLKEVSRSKDDCDVLLSSENLLFCFQYPFGLDTTQINGRLQKPTRGNYSNFYNYFRINQLKSRGTDPNRLSYLFSAVTRKISARLGLYKA
ncbi:MAG TPA: MBL fold metallo-hydrolase [Bacteroidia bacterium]|jgi:UDP-MurNAc hydroxylase|nr:MBL fold metallo-hydrolase [Bacteroidia bacterium]